MISNLRILNIIKGDTKLKKNGDNKKKKIKKIRCGMMNGSDIQEMIDKLIDWYKVRFPNYCLTVNNGAVEIDKLYRENSNCVNMTFDEFINRMVFSFETSLKCYYAKDIEATELQKFTNIDSTKAIVVKLYTIKEKFLKRDIDKVCFIAADKKNGRIISILDDGILPNDIKNNITKYNLENLLTKLNNSNIDNLNYNELKKIVAKRNNDIKSRSYIINEVTKNLLFDEVESDNDHKYNLFRAKMFLKEFSSFINIQIQDDYLAHLIINQKSDTSNKKKTLHKNYEFVN